MEGEKVVIPASQRVFGDIVYWITILAALLCIIGPMIAIVNMDKNVINPHYLMQNIFDGMKPDFEEQNLEFNALAGDNRIAVEDAEKFDDPEKVDRDIQIRILSDEGLGEIATIVAINKSDNTLELSDGLLNSYVAGHTEVAEVTVWDAKGNRRLAANAQAGQQTLELVSVERLDNPTQENAIAIMIEDTHNREVAMIESIDRQTNTLTLTSGLANSYSVTDTAKISQVTVVDDTRGGHFWTDNFTTGDGLTQFGLVLGCAVGLPSMIGAAMIFKFKEKRSGWALAALWIGFMIAVSAIGLISLE